VWELRKARVLFKEISREDTGETDKQSETAGGKKSGIATDEFMR
jgi:hypothetical protein